MEANHSLTKPFQESCLQWKSSYWLLVLKIYSTANCINIFSLFNLLPFVPSLIDSAFHPGPLEPKAFSCKWGCFHFQAEELQSGPPMVDQRERVTPSSGPHSPTGHGPPTSWLYFNPCRTPFFATLVLCSYPKECHSFSLQCLKNHEKWFSIFICKLSGQQSETLALS